MRLPRVPAFCLWTKVIIVSLKSKAKERVLVSLYHPPGMNAEKTKGRFTKLESLLRTKTFEKLLIMGDINIDSIKKGTASEKQLSGLTKKNDLVDKISGLTRVTKDSQTYIDIILVNPYQAFKSVESLDVSLSDHKLYAVTSSVEPANSPTELIEGRC